eukprot:s1255_g36.t1
MVLSLEGLMALSLRSVGIQKAWVLLAQSVKLGRETTSASMKFSNVAILSLLHLGIVFGNKFGNLRHGLSYLSQGSLGNLTVKLKADSFANPDTKIGEIGALRLLNSKGICISCTVPLTCSTLDEPEYKGEDVKKACNSHPEPGSNFSWKVNKSHEYDIRIDFPLEKLNGEVEFTLEVYSALASEGKNSEEEKGRQVTNWLSTTMLGKPGHLAWMKVAVNINGDLNSKMVKGIAGSELPAAAKDIYAGDCLRPADVRGYHVTELSLFRSNFNVMTACAGMYRGVAVATVCTDHDKPYNLSGCIPEI